MSPFDGCHRVSTRELARTECDQRDALSRHLAQSLAGRCPPPASEEGAGRPGGGDHDVELVADPPHFGVGVGIALLGARQSVALEDLRAALLLRSDRVAGCPVAAVGDRYPPNLIPLRLGPMPCEEVGRHPVVVGGKVLECPRPKESAVLRNASTEM